MKNFSLYILLLFLFLISAKSCYAGVTDSVHDMFAERHGSNPDVCSYCHVAHNAAGEKIWSYWGNTSQIIGGPSTTVGNLCYTCHDGTVTSVGQATAFNSSLQQHKMSFDNDCDMCHDVHDNTNGMFMSVTKKEESYCAGCHDGIVNAGGLGDHTNSGNHPSYWTSKPDHDEGKSPTGAGCNMCHIQSKKNQDGTCLLCHVNGHGAANYSTSGVTNPILREDNTDSTFCSNCHTVHTQTTSSGTKHAANLSSSGSWGKVGCETCHDPHQPGNPTRPSILRDDNVDSGYCSYCHEDASETYGPLVGHGHPTDMAFVEAPSDPAMTPAANAIDDDDENGPDYLSNSNFIVCETCHSVHKKGTATYSLRLTTSGDDLCLNCHSVLP